MYVWMEWIDFFGVCWLVFGGGVVMGDHVVNIDSAVAANRPGPEEYTVNMRNK